MNLRKTRTSNTVIVPDTFIEVANPGAALKEKQAELRTLTDEAEALDNRLADLLATRAMSGSIDVDELARVTERRDANRAEREHLVLIVAHMERNLESIRAEEGERARQLLAPELEALGATIATLEAQYIDVICVLSDTLEAMQAARKRHTELTTAWNRTPGGNQAGHGVDQVRPLPDLPESALKAQRRQLSPTLREIVIAWQEEPARHREHVRAESERAAESAEEERRKAQAALDRHIANWGPADKAPAEAPRFVYY